MILFENKDEKKKESSIPVRNSDRPELDVWICLNKTGFKMTAKDRTSSDVC